MTSLWTQQQSLDFPSVLFAISRWLPIIHKYANCSKQIHKYAKFQNKSTWFARSCSHFRGMCKLCLILSHCTRLDLQSKQDENAQNAQRLDQNAWDGFLEICTSALRVQVFFVCNIIVRIIMRSSRLQKCKLCLRHSCPFTTFYERRKAVSIAGEGNGATDAASADVW